MAQFADKMISQVSNEQSSRLQGVITMSKGSKAVCMRFPEPYIGIIEAEAAAKGISVPELCRRIIIERNQAAERERMTVPVTPAPTPSTAAPQNASAAAASATLNLAEPSQGVNDPLANAMVARAFANMMAEHPELSPPTPASLYAREALAKIAKECPRAYLMFAVEQFTNGKMSQQEVVEFLKLMGP